MILGNTTTITPDRPHMEVKAAANGIDYAYPLHFAQYGADGTVSLPNATTWNYILRNHIYRYEVNSLNVTADLVLKVLPWNLVEEKPWDFTENIIIEEGNFLEWDPESVEFDNKEEGIVTVHPSTTDVATATFTISAPLGGKWYATLARATGTEDAFYFVDENGDEVKTPSGDVGVQGVIRLKNRRVAVADSNNLAKLIIMVLTEDGRWIEADLCDGEPTNYYINQNLTVYN